jgi:hypothetical protein
LQHSRLTSLVEDVKVSLENSDVTSIDTTSLQESINLELCIQLDPRKSSNIQ